MIHKSGKNNAFHSLIPFTPAQMYARVFVDLARMSSETRLTIVEKDV